MKPVQWQEPVSFRNAINRRFYPRKRNLWPLVAIALGLTAVMILIPIVKQKPVDDNWPKSFLIAFGVGFGWLGLMLFLMVVNHFSSRFIVINPQGFFLKEWHGAAIRFTTWRWEHVAHCTIQQMDLEGTHYLALIAHLTDGRYLYMGLNILDNPRDRKSVV